MTPALKIMEIHILEEGDEYKPGLNLQTQEDVFGAYIHVAWYHPGVETKTFTGYVTLHGVNLWETKIIPITYPVAYRNWSA